MAATANDLPALTLLLALELLVLRSGQRRLFWATAGATRSRVLAYALAAPGTIVHEGAHYLACVALGVPVGRQLGARVRLFWPTRTADGAVVLGSVPHGRTDALRRSLIAIAPLIIVPSALALASAVLLGADALGRLPDSLGDVAAWRVALWAYLSFSCGQAVFPSPGDRIGALGWALLGALAALALLAVATLGGQGAVRDVAGAVVGVLALPAAIAGLSLLVLGVLRPRR